MKSKKLSLREMWELYKLLGKGTGQEYLLNEIIEMLKTIPPENIRKSMEMMYGRMPDNPLDLALQFVKGLKRNKFFEFQELVEKLS